MTYRSRILVFATVAAAALLAVSPALATKKPAPAPEPAPDPATTLAGVYTEALGSGALPPLEDSLVEADAADSLALAACYWAQVRRYGKNLLGMTLWSYYQRIEWCSNSTSITSVTRIRWGEVSMVGWSFKGHTGSTTGGGRGYTYYRARTQGHFCLVQYFSCVQNAYPWIDMTVYRNGTYSYSAGG